MMVSTLVFLLAPLMLLLTDARGLRSSCAHERKATTSSNKFRRLNKTEEEARADRLYPRWKSCCVNTWELSNHYEADLLEPNRQQLRTAIRDDKRKWSTTRIPYRIADEYFNKKELKLIRAAIEEFNTFTCVKFRPFKENDHDYIDIEGRYDGCATYVGKVGGAQQLNLEPRVCLRRRGNIYHLLMHALGFVHEHNSPARDNHVYINEGMVATDKKDWVKKYTPDFIRDYGYGYDYESIMHGSRTFASANRSSTIEPLDPNVTIGNKKVLSPIDILRVNYHFGCMQ